MQLPLGPRRAANDVDKAVLRAEEQRDNAAKYILTKAVDAADAAQLLDTLGINPADIGKRSGPAPDVNPSHGGARRRRFR